MNEKNRDVYANTFTVGLAHWLDQSPAALYWRSIEEGMAGYTANVLFSDGSNFGGGRRAVVLAGAGRAAHADGAVHPTRREDVRRPREGPPHRGVQLLPGWPRSLRDQRRHRRPIRAGVAAAGFKNAKSGS
jgi:hypothetical protein